MWSITHSLISNNWKPWDMILEKADITSAYLSAIRAVKHELQMREVDFLPLGNGEYIVWAHGKCQGFMVVVEEKASYEKVETDQS